MADENELTPRPKFFPNAAMIRKRRDHRIMTFRADLIRTAPHLDDPKFRAVLNAFAKVTILAGDSYEFLKQRGITGDDGELRSSIDKVSRLLSLSLKYARALNLTPDAPAAVKPVEYLDLAASRIEKIRKQRSEIEDAAQES